MSFFFFLSHTPANPSYASKPGKTALCLISQWSEETAPLTENILYCHDHSNEWDVWKKTTEWETLESIDSKGLFTESRGVKGAAKPLCFPWWCITSGMIFIISDITNVEAFSRPFAQFGFRWGLRCRQEARISSLHIWIVNKMYCCILSLLKIPS